MSYDSDFDAVRRRAEEQGFWYRKTERGHHQFYAPDGKSIITTSGTPGDVRGWSNFLADLKRAGYQPEFTAPAMAEALTQATTELVRSTGKSDWSASQLVLDYLSRHPGHVSLEDLRAYVRSIRPELTVNSANSALGDLMKQQRVVRVGRALYSLPAPPTETRSAEPFPPSVEPLATDDAALEEELRTLDEALAALARIETVVRKTREKLKAIAAAKKLLGP